jgi:hypothetical protein
MLYVQGEWEDLMTVKLHNYIINYVHVRNGKRDRIKEVRARASISLLEK